MKEKIFMNIRIPHNIYDQSQKGIM